MNLEQIRARPAALGIDPQKLQRIDALLHKGIQNQWFPAATYLVLRHGMIAAHKAFGHARPDRNPPVPAKTDTLFDLASLTKPFTATLLLQSVEQGTLHLNQRVGDLLPDARNTPVAPCTLRQLATHTSGLPAWKPLYKTRAPSILHDILHTTLDAEPGTRYTYSDLGYILLGHILQHVHNTPLDQLLLQRICKPLGMKHTAFHLPPELHNNTAPTANCPMRPGQILVAQVHDANAHALNGIAGHAGIFSSAPDLARFALAIHRTALAAHLQIPNLLGPLARKLATENQIPPHIGGHSIGWFTHPNPMLPRGDLLSERTFGHTGFTGTLLLCDPHNDLTLILLTNRVYAPGDGNPVLTLRRLCANILAGALTD